jgi:hypothetical protein
MDPFLNYSMGCNLIGQTGPAKFLRRHPRFNSNQKGWQQQEMDNSIPREKPEFF